MLRHVAVPVFHRKYWPILAFFHRSGGVLLQFKALGCGGRLHESTVKPQVS